MSDDEMYYWPVAWITNESLRRLAKGGNDSHGSVPVHAAQSRVAATPLYRHQSSDELARLCAENERLTGALQEIANTPTTPANHDLVAVIMLAQLALRDENGG